MRTTYLHGRLSIRGRAGVTVPVDLPELCYLQLQKDSCKSYCVHDHNIQHERDGEMEINWMVLSTSCGIPIKPIFI